MSDFLARLFGVITVEEKDNQIRVSGIPADMISYEIAKMWETSRINLHMFTTVGKNHFSFNRFFAIEVLYMVEILLRDSKRYGVKKALTEIARQLKTRTWLRQTYEDYPDILDWSVLNQFPIKPKPEQLEFMKTFNVMVPKMGLHGFYLAAAPGSGKTYMGAAVARMTHRKLRVVICPGKAVHAVWEKSLLEWFPKTPPYIVGAGKPYKGEADIICSFDMLEHLDHLLLTHKHCDDMFVLIDESHYLNEIDAQRTQLSIDLLRKYLCMSLRLSGTAWKAQGHEAIPYFMTIDSMFDEDARTRMYRIFGKDVRKGGDIFAHRLGLSVYKIEKSLAVDCPKPIEIPIPVRLDNADRYLISTIRADMEIYVRERLAFYERNLSEHYTTFDAAVGTYRASVKGTPAEGDLDRYVKYVRMLDRYYGQGDFKDIVLWCNTFERDTLMPTLPPGLREKFKKSKSVIKYVQLTVMGEALANVVGKRREECARDIAAALDMGKYVAEAEKKTLIYSSYVSVIKDAKRRLDKQGLSTSIVYQETNRDLPVIVKKFIEDEGENPILATFMSMGDAIDGLQKVANTVLMNDIPFRRYLYDQTVARLYRIGQTTQVYVLRPFLDTGSVPNINTRTISIMQAAEEQVAIMMSGGKLEKVPPGLNDALFTTTEERAVSISLKRVIKKAL